MKKETNLDNFVVLSDSYKFLHYLMYPENTQVVNSYFEAREGATFDETVFFGLQYYLKKYFEGVVVTPEKVAFAEYLAGKHFGNDTYFNKAGWQYLIDKHGGRLPLRIKAVPEGTPVPTSNVMMTVENTDPDSPTPAYWLTNYAETILTHVWSASTVATLSRHVKKMIAKYVEKTAETDAGLPFMLHDFGFRGVSSVESAAYEGSGHLVNFMGTDTVPAIVCAMEYYDADVCGFSVPASEHSIMTALGEKGEREIIKRLIEKFPTGILSVVGDSYDIFRTTAELVGGEFKNQILERDGVYVVRPDSGEPVPTVLKVLDILGEKFKFTINKKGYKVLNPKVRVIWGDGLNYVMIENILKAMTKAGWSAENIVFGMGGGLLQKINRDTQRFAFKSCAQRRDGVWHDIWKDPVDKSKVSKRGRLALVRLPEAAGGGYKTVQEANAPENVLQTVFEDGRILREYTFEEVRRNAALKAA